MPDLSCTHCPTCDGTGCIGQLPGMGGTDNNQNFILNCRAWSLIREKVARENREFQLPSLPKNRMVLRIAPVTGAVENLGFISEQDFKVSYIFSAYKAGLGLCTGDGYPDIKLQSGIGAVRLLQKTYPDARTAVFIKPYTNKKILERVSWTENIAEAIGLEIDRGFSKRTGNGMQTEWKTVSQIADLKKHIHLPFALKGIFLPEDVELVKEIRPDIAVISNNGGRIHTRTGSTADFLATYGRTLKDSCGELWVDGGIRTSLDIRTALALGASQVLAARPFIKALFIGGTKELCSCVRQLLS